MVTSHIYCFRQIYRIPFCNDFSTLHTVFYITLEMHVAAIYTKFGMITQIQKQKMRIFNEIYLLNLS